MRQENNAIVGIMINNKNLEIFSDACEKAMPNKLSVKCFSAINFNDSRMV